MIVTADGALSVNHRPHDLVVVPGDRRGGLVLAAVQQVRRAQHPLDPYLDDHPPRVDPRRAVALGVSQFGVADRVGVGVDAALPSNDSQRAPSTWLSTATPRSSALTAFCEPPVVMTRAMWVLGSKVKPTATTCGELSERSVVSMARWRSVRNASASLVSRVVAFAIRPNLAQDIIAAVKDTDDTGVVVIFGGRSEIGIELATRLARGATVVLAARRADDLEAQVAAVRAAGAAAVHVREFDADDLAAHGPLVDSIVADHGPIGTAVLAFGILGDQARAETDPAHAAAIVHTDFVAQVSLLTVLAATMRSRGPRTHRGVLVGGRRPGAPGQLRIRLGEGGSGRVRQRACRRAARLGGAAAAGPARLRDRPHDRGHVARAAVQHARSGGRRDRAALAKGRTASGCPRRWPVLRISRSA